MQDVSIDVPTLEKGSPAAFGARMGARLRDLIDNPYSFVPSYAQRYETLLQYCDSLTAHQAYAMSMLLGPDNDRGYASIPNTFGLTFPDANKVDMTAQVGWYYFVGCVKGKNGVEYGVILMMFQYTLLPPPLAEQFGLTPLENQTVDVQLAITTAGGRMHQAAPPFYSGTTGDIEVADRLFVRAGDNVVDTPSKDQLFPITLRASGADRGGPEPVPLSIDITLTSGNGYLLQGLDGCCPCVGGVGTRYYSIPNLAVDGGCSRITIGDETVELEGGTMWMDHQWGTGMVPNGAPTLEVMRAASNLSAPAPGGWDFFIMNFDDGSALTLSHIHTAADLPWMFQSGPDAPPERPPAPVSGKYMDPYGTVFNVSGMLTVTAWARGATSPDPAVYPVTDIWFPHGWTFEFTATILPERLRSIRFEPLSEDASAMFFANTAQYVEAPSRIFDAEGRKCGYGYSEAVGYENSTMNAAALAGLPPDVAKTIVPVTPSEDLVLLSAAYVELNKNELDAAIACGSLPAPARNCSCPP